MGAHAVSAARRPVATREAPATGPLARPGVARLVAFAPLAIFAALQWGGLLQPKADGKLLLGVLAALLAGVLLLVTGADARRAVRIAGAGGTTLALVLLTLLIAGVPAKLLEPNGWGELGEALGQGMESLPAITVPYRGADEWVRVALVASGLALLFVAALTAFWPRAGARVPGHQLAAAIALGALYTIPIVERGPKVPYFDGAVFCILLATFLGLERLRGDQVGVGAACVLAVAVAGGLVAPRLDAASPWLDYEQIAEDLQPEKAATFAWNHSYGPITWPRDGREVLRIAAPHQAYWKTVNLDEFDGRRWIDSRQISSVVDTEVRRRDWIETIRVVDRGLSSRQFVGAGHILGILPGGPAAVPIAPGVYETGRRPLAPGSSYRARVYVPRPTERELRAAGTGYPDFTATYLDMRLPRAGAPGAAAAVRFAPFGSRDTADAGFHDGFHDGGGDRAIRASAYARTYALARSLKADAKTPYDFVQAVLGRVQNGGTYSESPPPARVPLVDFLFGSKLGYCQQFSGAMALLLRMGGVPARVVSGFSPGRLDPKRGEYIVRDDDAHSWVEAYFPGIGWQTFDPTPPAAPARSQLSDIGPRTAQRRPNFPTADAADRQIAPGDPGARAADQGGSPRTLLVALGALAALLALAGTLVVRRGRLPAGPTAPELAELERALHRTGRTPEARTTLSALERTVGGSEAARGYLRAVRSQRYGGAAEGPTTAQRRALRRELAAGLGAGGRLRAWWALPPVVGRRGPYTG